MFRSAHAPVIGRPEINRRIVGIKFQKLILECGDLSPLLS